MHSTRKFGVVMTTAGPAALNAITGLAQAASDGDTVLLIHGTLPASKLHLGGLQDTQTFQCSIADVLKGLMVCQKNIENVVVRGKYDNDLAFDLKQRVVKG